ncbi:MAG: alpha-glucan family phosphorylase [Gammaproteobacteria bacterium]|nr:alpha-glucan family phosphorylase [Gammaproteobacteria bacterium]
MLPLDEFVHIPRIAYFSMEMALESAIPTYAGGLGVLAGDTLRTAADLELPMVGVTLVSRRGNFRQEIDGAGQQQEFPDPWEPERHGRRLGSKVSVELEQRTVWVVGWLYLVRSHIGGLCPVILLDTDLDENQAEDRQLTSDLYGDGEIYRLKQEALLGIGGVRLLQALGFEIFRYHMNEGHSALLSLELLRRYAYQSGDLRAGESPYNLPRVRGLCCFTTHTPVEAGHDRFSYGLVRRVLGHYIDLPTLQHLAGQEELNMTRLALNLSDYVNGVANRHAEVSAAMFPGYRVHAVTNGVHPYTWTSPAFRTLYDRYLPGWCHEPELLARADCCIPDAAVETAHDRSKQVLIERVRAQTGVALHPRSLILGFARRMTAYKRPELLFSDIERLKAIAAERSFQVVLAGKAHPKDRGGKELIRSLYEYTRALEGSLPVVFLPGYDMEMAATMVAGVDVWLNTPLPPLEASGTSGMKAAFNGVPSLSVLDGWWAEGCIEGVTGWAVGADGAQDGHDQDAEHLYTKLEQIVLPLYYGYAEQTGGWVRVMKQAISKNAAYFNSQRMMRRYATEAYLD